MPKKKKGKEKKELPLLDEIDPKELNEKQLAKFCQAIWAVIEQEHDERRHFKLEIAKIKEYWDITREQIETLRTEVRQKAVETEHTAEVDRLVATEKERGLKNFQHESSLKAKQARVTASIAHMLKCKQVYGMEIELLKDRNCLKRELHEQQELHEMQLKQERMRHHLECVYERINAENEGRDARMRRHEWMKNTRSDTLQLCHKSMKTVESIKERQIESIMKQNAKAFTHMKDYYNDITLSNLGVLSAINADLVLLKKMNVREIRNLQSLTAENKKLKEPLEKATVEVETLEYELESFESERHELLTETKRCRELEKEVAALKWEHQVLVLRNEVLEAERKKVKEKFQRVLMDMQRNAALKDVMISEKLVLLEKEAEKREAMLLVQNKATRMWKPHNCEEFRGEIENVLKAKEQELKYWEEYASRYVKYHDTLVHTGQNVLKAHHVAVDQVQILPVEADLPEICKDIKPDKMDRPLCKIIMEDS